MTDRFKGLHLTDRGLKNYRQRFITLLQKSVMKTMPMKKKCKWLSEEALQTAEKRREMKGKGAKERYTYLNAEF